MSAEDQASLKKALIAFWKLMQSVHTSEAEKHVDEIVEAVVEIADRDAE